MTKSNRFMLATAALAVAMLRHQQLVSVSPESMAIGLGTASWPARLHRLEHGPLTGTREVWLDGGHNPNAAAMLAAHFQDQKLHLVIGMIEGKDPQGFVETLGAIPLSTTVVPVPTHEWFGADAFGPGATFADDVPAALAALPDDGVPVLIAGSLYLAGEVLRLNDELPD